MRLSYRLPLLVLAAIPATFAVGQTPYKQPPRDVVAILDAPPPPRAILSPARDAVLLVEVRPYPSIELVAAPVLRLAGVRIDPQAGCTQRTTQYAGISIQSLDNAPARKLTIAAGASFHSPSWSHDGKKIALIRDLENGIELWVADAATGQLKPIAGARLNDVLADPITWLKDNRHILAVLVPADRGPAPAPLRAPIGPNVQESSGRPSQMPTFQDMLASPHDEDLFEHFATGQIARIDTETGAIERIGPLGLITAVEPSPDENYLLVSTVRRPFSYRVPYVDFARTTEVWDAARWPFAVVADLPIADDIPRQGVPTGPRRIHWQPLHKARLLWTEALDGGDPRAKVPHRDRVMALEAPFVTGEAAEVMKFEHRFSGFQWLPERDRVLATETDRDRRWRTTALVDLTRPGESRQVLFDLSVNDAYKDPGDPVTVTRPDGVRTILADGDSIYLAGDGAAPGGARPFLDKLNLKTGAKSRLFQCALGTYETPLGFVGDSRATILTRRETKVEPPNLFTVDLETSGRTKRTDYNDPAPQLTGLKKELITYRRGDGVPLSGTLYLPPGYREGTRLPLIVWAYPLEYSDPGTAGQVRTSPDTFTRLAGPSQLFFVTQGYAVLDNATMPVVGDPETMNDTYVEQISAAARAAIETLDKKGVIDPRRVGVGGHSYGAFMTANLLAHTDLFAAGIARSGAYNRSLTPFGFQRERRSYWEATDLYTKMSPFTYANKINEPILLIHGEADNNSGTFPIQSERLFQAIKGNGGVARLVLLPHESHAYRARESVLHVLAEMFDWADRYVKNRTSANSYGSQGNLDDIRANKVDSLFARWSRGDSPGGAVIVIKDGQVLLKKGYGLANLESRKPIEPDTAFLLASVTKQFTAMAIMILAERDKLRYDDPLAKFFPEFPPYAQKITVRHLLNHQAGFPEYDDLFVASGKIDEDWPRSIKTKPSNFEPTAKDALNLLAQVKAPRFAPGEKFEYSNSGYVILAQIVEQVSGQSFSGFLQQNIFQPLGMKRSLLYDETRPRIQNVATSYTLKDGSYKDIDYTPQNAIYGEVNIYTTVDDMYKWDQSLYTEKLVGAATLKEAFTPGKLNDGSATGYGFGWGLSRFLGLDAVSHSGGWLGFRTYILRFPDQHFTVVVLANLAQGNVAEAAQRISKIYLAEKMTFPEAIQLAPEVLQKYIGKYGRNSSIIEIGFDDNMLWRKQSGREKEKLLPESATRFFIEGREEVVVSGIDSRFLLPIPRRE